MMESILIRQSLKVINHHPDFQSERLNVSSCRYGTDDVRAFMTFDFSDVVS